MKNNGGANDSDDTTDDDTTDIVSKSSTSAPGDVHQEPYLQPGQSWLATKLHEIIFEADTIAGKAFDVALLLAIVLSVSAVMLESVAEISKHWGPQLIAIEWFFTILFTFEYLLRLYCVRRPWRYAISFFGLVDLLSIVPTYLSVVTRGTQVLLVIRTLRLVRVFRIFKLHQYVNESRALFVALHATRKKIAVFILVVATLVMILGSAMYLIEGSQKDTRFTSIPKSVYWAVVTMTTVGYGDIAPQTALGQGLATVAMLLGYSIIIVPTGIFSVEIIMAHKQQVSTKACTNCSQEGHDYDAIHCKFCGAHL